jgi:hypothetical protein
LRLEANNVLLSALYSDQGRVYARFYESQGRSGKTTIQAGKGKILLKKTDLLGRVLPPTGPPVSFNPWQIQTFQLELAN